MQKMVKCTVECYPFVRRQFRNSSLQHEVSGMEEEETRGNGESKVLKLRGKSLFCAAKASKNIKYFYIY